MNYKVYLHSFPNGRYYVGITKENPEDRWKNGFGYARNYEMFYDIVKYGWDNIKHEVLYTELTEEEASKIEKELIIKYNSLENGYNRSLLDTIKKAKEPKNMYPKKPIICVETNEEFESIMSAMRAKNIKGHNDIQKAIDNPNRTCSGFHWISKNIK